MAKNGSLTLIAVGVAEPIAAPAKWMTSRPWCTCIGFSEKVYIRNQLNLKLCKHLAVGVTGHGAWIQKNWIQVDPKELQGKQNFLF